MKQWMTYHRFALGNALRRVFNHPLSMLVNALVIAMALVLPFLGYAVLVSVQPVTRDLAADPEVAIFMKADATEATLKALETNLRAQSGEWIESIRVVKREQALEAYRQRPGYAEALAVLPLNPFPDAVFVRLKRKEGAGAVAERLVQAFRSSPGVDRTQLDSAWVQKIEATVRLVRVVLALLMIGLGTVVVAVVFNTVRLQALTQKDEVEVSRLMGATTGFIMRPFLYLGVLQGLAGGLMALVLAWVALGPLNRAVAEFARSYASQFQLSLPGADMTLAFLCMSLALGWLGAAWSARQHLSAA